MSNTNIYQDNEYLSAGLICPKIPNMSILGDNLRRLRQEVLPDGTTQADVAVMLGVLPHNYTPFETGSKTPGDEFLQKLADLYKIDLKELLEWKEADVIAKKYSPKSIEQANKVITGGMSTTAKTTAKVSGEVKPAPSGDDFFNAIKDLPDEKLVEAVQEKFGVSKDVLWALIEAEKKRRKS